MINRYVAPGLLGERGGKLKPLPADRPSFNLNSHPDTTQASVISSLLDRIHGLEEQLASATLNEQARSGTLPRQESSDATSGQFVKSKFYGQSHWINAIDPYDALGAANTTINENTNRKEVNKSTELYATVSEVKRMARIIKASRMSQPSISPELQACIPPREISDALVDCYLRTFEGVFRVLHVPSFKKIYDAYWLGTMPAKPSIVHKFLLVCAIGVPFYTGPEQAKLRVSAVKWIQAAAEWQSAPHAKSRLNMIGLQIQILILIARQVCNVDGDHIWIPAGTLLRTAMHLGLHRDPSHFPKISVYHGEMRRRLWATVLEITAQSSLDMGMPPMVSLNDYDTKPPSNINDEDMGEGIEASLDAKSETVFTDSSIQIGFTRTLPVRLEIIKLINNLRFDLPYDDVLRVGSELISACRKGMIFFKAALAAGHNITPFQIKMCDTLVRRFVLCLHRPYFSKAFRNPRYHYSRKICLDTSLAIYAPATDNAPDEEDDWTRMTQRCVGFFKSFFLYGMSTVYYELTSQINERLEDAALFAPMVSARTPTSSTTGLSSLPAQYQPLREVLESSRCLAIARIHNGETNAKGVVFINCALARIDALISGNDPDAAVLEAAKSSTSETSRILAEVYREEHGEEIDLGLSSGCFNGREHGRGEGADDITGKHLPTGTDVQRGFSNVADFPSFDGTMEGMNMLDADLGDMNMGVDVDINAYMQGQPMDIGSGFHFGRSPEWFYDLNGWAGTGNPGNLGYGV
ncbi:hypothetical protein AA0113_g5700 [Alternaria arborescens]|uniref:Xylanolytic transcriptional activator regulatory domain-containing protein n=1 Tax=Alternaria arborescens TaxID=156630 RepID=A0A4Q4S4H4_9PLEO|nr:hypothetical protein AA0111_g2957 [Alternaria arborescens]RYO36317.1 hypothetical protein AA0111_g2957 [Alternaria arborescens]RYO64833.1 hypothetical protein AA0113_g5700 [Alternaria arborescens]